MGGFGSASYVPVQGLYAYEERCCRRYKKYPVHREPDGRLGDIQQLKIVMIQLDFRSFADGKAHFQEGIPYIL